MLALGGCAPQTTTEINEDDAAAVLGLELSEDGNDEDFADASGEGVRHEWACGHRDLREHIVADYDANGDGSLDGDERTAMRADYGDRRALGGRMGRAARRMRLRMIHRTYDGDRDGQLGEEERAELHTDLNTRCENRHAQLLQHFDVDGSGDLDEDEWAHAREVISQRFEARRATFIEDHDVDGDGRLSDSERLEARQDVRDRIEDRREVLRTRFDTNADGDLDDSEREALREHLKARVRGEHFFDDEVANDVER